MCTFILMNSQVRPASSKKKKKNKYSTEIDDAVLNEPPSCFTHEWSANLVKTLEVHCFINADMHMPKCQ